MTHRRSQTSAPTCETREGSDTVNQYEAHSLHYHAEQLTKGERSPYIPVVYGHKKIAQHHKCTDKIAGITAVASSQPDSQHVAYVVSDVLCV